MPFSMRPGQLHYSQTLEGRKHEWNERTIRHEAMRIGGEKVTTKDVVEVLYPYTDRSDRHGAGRHGGTCGARFRDCRQLQAKLTRYERQQILFRDRGTDPRDAARKLPTG